MLSLVLHIPEADAADGPELRVAAQLAMEIGIDGGEVGDQLAITGGDSLEAVVHLSLDLRQGEAGQPLLTEGTIGAEVIELPLTVEVAAIRAAPGPLQVRTGPQGPWPADLCNRAAATLHNPVSRVE
ncbi:MAG: hypothetical protein ERJ67_10255 [Aphanocapsa feldmannii 277cV]|uniref:Uncharacterized protein n=1 Tax=Aphanocapsa feldmannii 277cV TaxID=2507553 RepID=A0A524RKQ1_9CHRO|nr:MAG: hypothetical protein ERJ67_10255 [Aphanocapsa feldmannii 277cV]